MYKGQRAPHLAAKQRAIAAASNTERHRDAASNHHASAIGLHNHAHEKETAKHNNRVVPNFISSLHNLSNYQLLPDLL